MGPLFVSTEFFHKLAALAAANRPEGFSTWFLRTGAKWQSAIKPCCRRTTTRTRTADGFPHVRARTPKRTDPLLIARYSSKGQFHWLG